MKKAAALLFCAALLMLPLSFECSARHTEDSEYNWYCKNNDTHTVPILPSEFSFVCENGGYYADTRTSDKVIYLTFDAGYENGNVERILDVMQEHEVNGAFFILSNLIHRESELVRRMAEEGHEVCNHTSNHKNMARLDNESFARELDELAQLYLDCTGREISRFYRPPMGIFSERNLRCAENMGYKTIFWSFAYADWDNDRQPSPEQAYEKIMAHTHPGAVILLHPTSKTNADILGRLIEAWRAEGYRFGSLSELVGNA